MTSTKRPQGGVVPLVLRMLGHALLLLLMTAGAARAQGPASNPDHPPGNVDELTLARLRPGRSTLPEAVRLYGPHWFHPTPQETDLYLWSDPARHLLLSMEVSRRGVIRVVSVTRTTRATATPARLPLFATSTGRGMRLGDSEQRLLHIYGKPFFEGPSSLDGKDVHLIVFNFSWAGADKPQILESSFNHAGRLMKMTLSADYY